MQGSGSSESPRKAPCSNPLSRLFAGEPRPPASVAATPARRARPNPLYSSGGSRGKQQAGGQRTRSLPASPTGITKPKPVASRGPARAPPPSVRRQQRQAALLGVLEGVVFKAASAPASPASPPSLPVSPGGALDAFLGLGRLQLTSPTPSPTQLPPAPAGSPPAAPPSLTRTPASRQLHLGKQSAQSSPAAREQPEVDSQPSSGGQCAQPSPGQQQQQHPQQEAQGSPAAPQQLSASREQGQPPASPFHSSQERRQEIAVLSELAPLVWSSQEEEGPRPQQEQQLQSGPGVQMPPPSPFSSCQERRDEIALLSGLAQLALGSQDLPPATTPQQPGAAAAAMQQGVLQDSSRPNSQGAEDPAEEQCAASIRQHGDGEPAAADQAAAWASAFAASGRAQPQQPARPNQWAAVGGPRPAAPLQGGGQQPRASLKQSWLQQRPGAGQPLRGALQQAEQQRRPQQQRPGAGQPFRGAPQQEAQQPRQLEQQQQRPQQQQQDPGPQGRRQLGVPRAVAEGALLGEEAAGDALVAATCPQKFHGVRESFPSQREAFACADQHNSSMPWLPPRTLVPSCVPEAELLPLAAGHAGGAAQAPSGSASGSAGSGMRPRPSEEGEVQQQQQQRLGQQSGSSGGAPPLHQGPHDFLSRYQHGAPPAGVSAYTAPAPKRARREEGQLPEQSGAFAGARDAYRAALTTLQPAPEATEAAAAAADAGAAAAAAPGPSVGAGSSGSSLAARCSSSWEQPGWAAAEEGGHHEEGVQVFCVERRARSSTYYRTFAAASYPAVWAYFRKYPPEQRHWYEVVREGRPCHLYFDLEYVPDANPEADGDALVEALLQHVEAQLGRHWGLPLDRRCVYELDSSTPAKFSRHLTVRLPGYAFANNHAMGKFVAQVVAASGEELQVAKGGETGAGGARGQAQERCSMVDCAVYSRNRHWRMSLCCKGGKSAVLRPTARFATAAGTRISPAALLLDTLVCNVAPDTRLLQMPDPLPCGLPALPAAALLLGGGGGSAAAAAAVCAGELRVARRQDLHDGSLAQDEVADLQRLAAAAVPFIERAAKQRAGGLAARARTMAFCGFGRVAYSMLGPGSHHCENAGRPHTSNHVFFVADFVQGTYAQKCHDPDCASYRSGWMPLPPELCLPPPAEQQQAHSGGGGGGSAGPVAQRH